MDIKIDSKTNNLEGTEVNSQYTVSEENTCCCRKFDSLEILLSMFIQVFTSLYANHSKPRANIAQA